MARVLKARSRPAPSTMLGKLVAEHLEWLLVNNYSEETAVHRRQCLGQFIRWAEERGIEHPAEITRAVLESYQRYLYYYRQKNGQPLAFRTQHSRLMPMCRWFRWMVKQNYILYNPAADLDLPRIEKRIPRTVFTAKEAEQVLLVPDIHSVTGLRDRAMLETFYSSGVRRKELIQLKLYDLDRQRGTMLIRLGKGKKDRMIPIGERALAWIEKYLRDARPELVSEPDDLTVFLTQYGEAFNPDVLSSAVRHYVERANLGKAGSCHTFRHSMATLMLEGGADIRYIQQMLGHEDLQSTEIYTHVAIRVLQQIHAATHPGALIESKSPAGANQNSHDEQHKAALLAVLDNEADEEE